MSGRKGKRMRKAKTDNRIWARVLALLMAAMLVLGVLLSAAEGLAEEAPARDRYDLAIDVLFDRQAAQVTETFEYTNRTGEALDEMMFSVYANVLRRQTAVPVEADEFENAFPEGYAPGGVDFMSVKVNGEAAQWGVQGEDELFLRVECHMEPGETVVFRFDFYVLLPVYSGAMGIGDLSWRLVNFYPVAAVWDEYLHDFPMDGYTAMHEPLSSDAADYHVSLSLPETYHLAAPGVITRTPDGMGMVFYEIDARGIRELALVFSRKTTERTAQTESGTTIRALGNAPASADRMIQAALPAMNWLEAQFGAYPWDALTLIETEYLRDGLSHPGVIQVSNGLTGLLDGEQLENAIVGLCAQQYFGAIAGNRKNAAPWLSEAIPSFVSLLYFEEKNGYNDFMKRLNAQVLPALSVTIPGGLTPDSESERFVSRMEFEVVVVCRGMAVLYMMRRDMGEALFMEGLQEYVSSAWLGRATAADFLAAMNKVSGRRWDEYLYGQMHTLDDYVGTGLNWFE